MFNFAEATANATAGGAALAVADADALIGALAELLEDPARRGAMRDAALAFHAAHKGAGERLWRWLAPQLDAALARALSRRGAG